MAWTSCLSPRNIQSYEAWIAPGAILNDGHKAAMRFSNSQGGPGGAPGAVLSSDGYGAAMRFSNSQFCTDCSISFGCVCPLSPQEHQQHSQLN